jgi:hypothetical protein
MFPVVKELPVPVLMFPFLSTEYIEELLTLKSKSVVLVADKVSVALTTIPVKLDVPVPDQFQIGLMFIGLLKLTLT